MSFSGTGAPEGAAEISRADALVKHAVQDNSVYARLENPFSFADFDFLRPRCGQCSVETHACKSCGCAGASCRALDRD